MRALMFAVAVMLSGLVAAQEATLGQELLKNGSFETPDASGQRPAHWGWSGAMQWVSENGNHWIVQDAATPASMSASQNLPLGDNVWKLRVSGRVRVTHVVLGAEGWHNARLAMQFQDADRKMVGAWPNVLNFTGSTEGWQEQQRDYLVPAGAKWLSLSCSLFATTGKVEWDDVSVKLLKLRPVLEDATLPAGVQAAWDTASAWQQQTPTRGRVCLNGLWRFHPVDLRQTDLPAAGTGWGYYKVPGTWTPGNACMTPLGPDIWEDQLDLNKTDAAWYQRRVSIPARWAGRRILIALDNLKQTARVLVDGQEAGQVLWPGGKVDITRLAKPGGEQELSVYVLALPLEPEQIKIAREDLIEKVRAETRFKGLCGDCTLESEPMGARVEDVFLKPSVQRGGLGVACELSGLDPARRYKLRASIAEGGKTVKTFAGPEFAGSKAAEFFAPWHDPKLWDLDQPNLYTATVELLDSAGKVLDVTTPTEFGFREFWIQGQDFMLNGKRIHLRCLDYFNMGRDFAQASLPIVKETFRRARNMGFNYVIHGNYDYEPQSFAYISDTLRAGDQLGFPMSYSTRHVSRLYRDFENPEKRADWNRIVDYEVKQVRNHPCVFMWAMNHNFTGWADDQSPALLPGKFQPSEKDDPEMWRRRHAATLAEQYVIGLDGTRPCYHHQSGTLNQMTTLNCYLCFTPLQERIEWLSAWASEGVKPLFFVEFGLPHQASWGGHRTGPFIWRNNVSSEPLVQEFGAMYYGDDAYDLPEYAEDHYDTIAKVYARHEPFGIWDVLGAYWSNRWEKNFEELKTLHTRYTWPAFRTYGISSILPWDQADLFKPIANAQGKAQEFPTDWARLQRPGIAPDFRPADGGGDWLTTADFAQVEPTSLGRMFARVNRETLAYLVGPARRFTAQDHLFQPGEKLEKQVAIINDLRRDATFGYSWSATLAGKPLTKGQGSVKVAAGDKTMIPFSLTVPAVKADTPGQIVLTATLDGKTDETLKDRFDFTVLAPTPPAKTTAKIALYDPKGLTAKLLTGAGVRCQTAALPTAPAGTGLFIVGREAMTLDGPGLDLAGLTAQGTNVLICEQSEEVLQRRWGFRTASPGVRRAFVRQPGHPVCKGLTDDLLRDWRGSSSLLPAYPLKAEFHRSYPQEMWCGFLNSRTWQWGNYGSVASVVIEKPARGNWSNVLDCEFDQQYTPLTEWLAPKGRVIFSQLDFSGRDLPEPAAQRLLENLLAYAQQPATAKLAPCRIEAGADFAATLKQLGVQTGGREIAVIGPGASPEAAKAAGAEAQTIVCLGLDGKALSAVLPFGVTTEEQKLTHTLIGRPTSGALVGLGNSEFHWRARLSVPVIHKAPDELQLPASGIFAEGSVGGKRYVLMQSTPAMLDWQGAPQLKRTWRHSLVALARVLTNCGVALDCPLQERLNTPAPVNLDLSGPWRFVTDPEKKLPAAQVAALDFDATGWRELQAPGGWEAQGADLKDYDGIAWYRKEFDLKAVPAAAGLTLQVGAVDDEDWTYLNGQLVGHIGTDNHPEEYWSADRVYAVPPGLLHVGRNVIAVRVSDLRGGGGIVRGPLGLFEPGRWLDSYYLDEPVALDDPYRYNRW